MSHFETYDLSLTLITALRPLIASLAQQDRKLEDQLRRAGSSIPLNIAEGNRRMGKDRAHFFRIAAGSAAEARAALEVARAWGSVDAARAREAEALLDRLCAMLWRLTHPRS